MEYSDFQLRAWRSDDAHVQMLVHASPAGSMDRPTTVEIDPTSAATLADLDALIETVKTYRGMIPVGQRLAAALIPDPVATLLKRSLAQLAPGAGLRVRLCLDDDLARWPWEFIHWSADGTAEGLDGFMVLDPRISLVRGAPLMKPQPADSIASVRMLFVGALGESDKADPYQVVEEYDRLSGTLEPVGSLLHLDFVRASGDAMEIALTKPADVFHYAGHSSDENGRGYLMRNVETPRGSRLYIDRLDDLLRAAGTRLAVLNACNSSRMTVAGPLLRAGIPAVVGASGTVWTQTAIQFCERLYAFLAVGLSLDQAVSSARHRLIDADMLDEDHCEWGRFVVHLVCGDSVLFPKSERDAIEARRDVVLHEHEATLNRSELRKKIVSEFSPEEIELLAADVEETLRGQNIKLQLSLEALEGKSLEAKVLALIRRLDGRGQLSLLADVVRRERP